MAIECGFDCDGGEKVFVEFFAELAQIGEGKIVQLDAFFKGEANGVADLLVRGTEGNSLVHEVGGGGHGVEVAGLSRFAHAGEVELERRGEARYESQHLRHKFNGECRLLCLLHIFIVGQRQALQLQRDCLGSAVNASDFGANQFGEIGIFLLRHGA